MKSFLNFIARVLLAQVFFLAMLIQLAIIMRNPVGYDHYIHYLTIFGLPELFAPLMILIQLLFGFSLLIGFKTKLSAYVLALYAVFVAIALKLPDPNPGGGLIGVMQYLAISGGYIMLGLSGPTAFSIDNLLHRKK